MRLNGARMRLLAVAVVGLWNIAGTGWSAGPDDDVLDKAATNRMERLQRRLNSIGAEVAQKQSEIAKYENRYYRVSQHDMVRTNAVIGALQEDVARMEKEIAEKRKALNKAMMEIPEMKTLAAESDGFFNELRLLRLREDAIQNELKAERAEKMREGVLPQIKMAPNE